MKQTSSATGLSTRLREKLERERQEIESVTGSELRRLGENLRRIASEERRITEAATEEAIGRLRGDAAVELAAAADDRRSALDRHLRGELGSDAVVGVADPEPDRDQGLPGGGDRAAAGDRGAVAGEQLGDPAAGDSQGAVRGAAARDTGPSALDRGREAAVRLSTK